MKKGKNFSGIIKKTRFLDGYNVQNVMTDETYCSFWMERAFQMEDVQEFL